MGLGTGTAALVAHGVGGRLAWSLVPFGSTVVYPILLGAQFAAAEEHGPGDPPG